MNLKISSLDKENDSATSNFTSPAPTRENELNKKPTSKITHGKIIDGMPY
jgi:hypothetical protein